MRLAIDASNIRQGGGVTHLVSLLTHAAPEVYGFSSVTVWCNASLQSMLPERDWLHCVVVEGFDRSLLYRAYWQRFQLPRLVQNNADILFVPGGNYQGKRLPCVTMFQNLLPFTFSEVKKYFPSLRFFRLIFLKHLQLKTFKRSCAVICLSQYAKRSLESKPVGVLEVIPHGVNPEFDLAKKSFRNIEECSIQAPFRLLYVSTVNYYKHQLELVEAVVRLRDKGIPVCLDLVGPAYNPVLKKLLAKLRKVDPSNEFITYRPSVKHADLPALYSDADMFVYPSACENLPIILLEAMTAKCPIASSNRGVMPDVLRDAGVYFDPSNVDEIALVVEALINDKAKREALSVLAGQYAAKFTWKVCAERTFQLLATHVPLAPAQKKV